MSLLCTDEHLGDHAYACQARHSASASRHPSLGTLGATTPMSGCTAMCSSQSANHYYYAQMSQQLTHLQVLEVQGKVQDVDVRDLGGHLKSETNGMYRCCACLASAAQPIGRGKHGIIQHACRISGLLDTTGSQSAPA